MNHTIIPANPYLLLTPGPLSTTEGVRASLLTDWCTWDREYNELVQGIRSRLIGLAGEQTEGYTTVLMQGSGTFSVESVIGTVIPQDGKLLVLANGAYGRRIGEIARVLGISYTILNFGELAPPDVERVQAELTHDSQITHVAVVHSETTTGMLNPIEEIGRVVKENGKVFIVDAMSSFGGIEMDVSEIGADFLISSANKCIQGVPGFGFVLARTDELAKCAGQARSLSLDLYDQWKTMEEQNGKWRFTSPTHTVHAFATALTELAIEGGVAVRAARYRANQRTLVEGMRALGFQPLLPDEYQSPIITSFLYPTEPEFSFAVFYEKLKEKGFVIYPGKVTAADTFRIGSIGDVHPSDMERLVQAIADVRFW